MSDTWIVVTVIVAGLVIVGSVMAFFARRDRIKRRHAAVHASSQYDMGLLPGIRTGSHGSGKSTYATFDDSLLAKYMADRVSGEPVSGAERRRKREAAAERRRSELAADADLTDLATAAGVYGSTTAAPDSSSSHSSTPHYSSGSGSRGYGHSGASHDYGSSHSSGGSDSGGSSGGGDSGGGGF
ncbi:MAG: hypothetical protein WC054_00295 [Candidatus Nanopelagicales bacterium]